MPAHSFLNWIHNNPHWAGFLTFLIAFFESLAVVGLLLPGTVVMTAIGMLIGTGILPFGSIMVWAVLGAIGGDVLSFWLGTYYKEQIRDIWPFRKHPHLLKKGEIFFQTHGGKGVFLGRFVGPVRPILPLIAGMMSMPVMRFVSVDIISGILWAPLYLLPGILLGYASQELPPELATRLIIAVILILIAFWCVSWLLKRSYYKLHALGNQLLGYLWQTIAQKPHGSVLRKILIDASRPHSYRQLGLAISWCIAFIAFAMLALSAFKQHGILLAWNQPLYHFLRSLRVNGLDQVFVAITFIGEAAVMYGLWLVVAIWLLLRNRQTAKYWLINGLLAGASDQLLKALIKSPRPTGLLLEPTGWSFPSGHSTLSMALFGFLAVLLSEKMRETGRTWVYWLLGLLIIFIGFSRLYLGAHWLTDVIGGWLLGFLCLAFSTIFYRRHLVDLVSPLGLLITALLSLVIIWSAYFYTHYTRALQNYLPVWSIHTLDLQTWWTQGLNGKPAYRNNRFGHPVQILNVQWAGNLEDIEQGLARNNWNFLPRPNLLLTLQEVIGQKQNRKLPMPVMTQLYQDRKPVLIMVKELPEQHALLVMRLWDAHLKLSNNQPLWVGVVSYHEPWQANFLRHHKHHLSIKPHLSQPVDVLSSDLPNFVWKKITYMNSNSLDVQSTENGNSSILLIRILK